MSILLLILIFFTVDIYGIWESKQIYLQAETARYAPYKPSKIDRNQSFDQFRTLNPEVIGWITIFDTNIDYPVVQGKDNRKYINTNPQGKYSLAGAIFLDARCRKDLSDFNSIIYGHHMEKQVMFGELGLFIDEQYFEAHRHGMLYCDDNEYGLDICLVLVCDAYDTSIFTTNLTDTVAKEVYINDLLGKAKTKGYDCFSSDDHIVLMVTCASGLTNQRTVVVARVTDELHLPEDIWRELPVWQELSYIVELGVILLFSLLLCLVIWCITSAKRRERDNHAN